MTVTHPDITLLHDISEAAQLVLQASAMARGGEVFVLDMGEPVKIVELAKEHDTSSWNDPYLEADAATEGGYGSVLRVCGPVKTACELLVGSDVSGTDHPRIMCADESKLGFDQLQNFLESLQRACDEMDVPSIKSLMETATVEFRPTGAVTDLLCPASSVVSSVRH